MYSNVIRSEEYVGHLKDFIKCNYDIEAISIIPAKRGFYGETVQQIEEYIDGWIEDSINYADNVS